jgi:hypothetical protein
MVCQVFQELKDKREIQDEMACLDKADRQVHEERWVWMGLLAKRDLVVIQDQRVSLDCLVKISLTT